MFDWSLEQLGHFAVTAVIAVLFVFHTFWILILLFRVKVLDKIVKTDYGPFIISLLFVWFVLNIVAGVIGVFLGLF